MFTTGNDALTRFAHGDAPISTARPMVKFVISGKDAVSFLQGQVTQDVSSLAVGDAAWTFWLVPNGKTICLVRMWREGNDQFAFLIEPACADALEERIRAFLFRVSVQLEKKMCTLESVRSIDESLLINAEDNERRWPAGWENCAGWDIERTQTEDDVVQDSDMLMFESARIVCGIPSNEYELTNERIPQETLFVDHAVSFTKGCFVGQELVARIDSRGRSLWRLVNFVTEVGAGAHPGADVTREHEIIGRITSVGSYLVENQTVSLGYLHHSVRLDTTLYLGSGHAVHAKESGSLIHSLK